MAVTGPVSVTVPAVPENCARLPAVHVVSDEPLTYQSAVEAVFQFPAPPLPVPDFCPDGSQNSVVWAETSFGKANKANRRKNEIVGLEGSFINK